MIHTTNTHRRKAVVIGASIAGLLAARALADYFEAVTLLERDTFPDAGVNRKGVPQGKHTHVLLQRGHEIMEAYFPGLTADLKSSGAVIISDVSANVRWFHSGGYHQPGKAGFAGLAVSRSTLETAIRQRVLSLSNVSAVQNCSVTELLTTPDNAHVTGVRLVHRDEDGTEETILADLVVDASGRGSRSPQWLETLGYKRPQEEEVRIGMGYVSCYFRRKPQHIPGLEGIMMMATPPDKRLGVLLAQDGNRWVLTVGDYLGEHTPTDARGFMEAVRQLPTKDIYQVVSDAEMLGEPVPYTFPANLRWRYDKLKTFPDRYLVIGDALCSFNPIYAQGMTVAALEAQALDECLAQNRGNLARDFFTKASEIIDIAWDAAVGTDLSYPEVEGTRTPLLRFLNWYFGKLHIAAQTDAQVSIAFLKVINMVAPPPSILHPGIVWRVIKGNLQQNQQHPSAIQLPLSR